MYAQGFIIWPFPPSRVGWGGVGFWPKLEKSLREDLIRKGKGRGRVKREKKKEKSEKRKKRGKWGGNRYG